jgi:hypothetical protein
VTRMVVGSTALLNQAAARQWIAWEW